MVRSLAGPNLSLTGQPQAGGAEPFDPESVANLTWWIDPDESATVTLISTEIQSVDDKIDGTSNAQLIIRDTQPGAELVADGGRDWMEFNGGTSDRSMEVSDATLTAVSPDSGDMTIFVVVKPYFTGTGTTWAICQKGFTGWFRLFCDGASTGSLSMSALADESGGAAFRRADTADDVMTQNAKHIIRMTIDRGNDLMRIHVDGTQEGTADISTLGAVTDTGEKFTIGMRAAGAAEDAFWDGLIGEVLFYKDTIDGTDATNIEAYLAAKWSTA